MRSSTKIFLSIALDEGSGIGAGNVSVGNTGKKGHPCTEFSFSGYGGRLGAAMNNTDQIMKIGGSYNGTGMLLTKISDHKNIIFLTRCSNFNIF